MHNVIIIICKGIAYGSTEGEGAVILDVVTCSFYKLVMKYVRYVDLKGKLQLVFKSSGMICDFTSNVHIYKDATSAINRLKKENLCFENFT
jgi:hypothetical protein